MRLQKNSLTELYGLAVGVLIPTQNRASAIGTPGIGPEAALQRLSQDQDYAAIRAQFAMNREDST